MIGCEPTLVKKAVSELENQRNFESEIYRELTSTGRDYYAQFPAPVELYALVRILRPEVVVESGVSCGISSAHILLALERNNKGKLYSVDFPVVQKSRQRQKGDPSWALPYGKSSGWAIPKRLKANWELLIGKSEELLPKLVARLGHVDIFCHDSPVSARHLAFELQTISKVFRPGSALIADNAGAKMNGVMKTAEKLGAHVFPRRHSQLIAFRVPQEK